MPKPPAPTPTTIEPWALVFVSTNGTWSSIGGHYCMPEEYLRDHGHAHAYSVPGTKVYLLRADTPLPVPLYPETARARMEEMQKLATIPQTKAPEIMRATPGPPSGGTARARTGAGAAPDPAPLDHPDDTGTCVWCNEPRAPRHPAVNEYLHPWCVKAYMPRSSGDGR